MTAIVFVSGLGRNARLRVAGLGLLERALLVANRVGIKRCLLAGVSFRQRDEPRFPRLTPVNDLPDAEAVLRSEGATARTLVLCLSADAVTTPKSLRALLDSLSVGAETATALPPVAVVPFESLGATWQNFSDSVRVSKELPSGFFVVRNPQSIGEVEKRFLRSLHNPRDGRIDTLLNRKLSRRITPWLLRLSATPNGVTLLAFVAGSAAAWAFAGGGYGTSLLGAVLFQLSAVLDCCDGEVARAKLAESRFGDMLDLTLDTIANVAVFLGIARGAWLKSGMPDASLWAAAVAAGLVVAFPLVTYVERSLPASRPQYVMAQKLVSLLTTRDFSAIIFLAALTGTLPWFLRGAAIGAGAFSLSLVVLLVRGRASRQPRE